MRIVYLTAGAGGMYCGSCLHDNSLAKSMHRLGHEALLVPLYTPIRTDQSNASEQFLFYGGISVYLQQLSPMFRWLPKPFEKLLNHPGLISWFASRASATSAKQLGGLTVSMLQGADGRQRKEVLRLCQWLREIAPDAIIFSNLLIAGCVSNIANHLPETRLAVMLQGDDIFYESLTEPFRQQALSQMRRLAGIVDQFFVHSDYYRNHMSQLLQVEPEKMKLCPLSIDAQDLLSVDRNQVPRTVPRVGYLARIAPEKGLHLLVDAFVELKQAGQIPDTQLEIAGWLGNQHEAYWKRLQVKLDSAGLKEQYRFWGTVDRQQKADFLQLIDLLSVPTTYREPKGLFVLEAMAAGVPYLLPAHGAFLELHGRANCGQLHQPDSVAELKLRLLGSLQNIQHTRQLAQSCREYVLAHATPELEANTMIAALSRG